VDRLDFALRQYQELAPKRPGELTRLEVDRFRLWISDDVCAAVEGYTPRPAFQDCATWSLRSLAPGATTSERGLVNAIDASLVESAGMLLRLADFPAIQNQLAAANRPTQYVSRETVQIGSDENRVLGRELSSYDQLAFERSQVESVTAHFWDDLVSPLDYFGPYRAFRFQESAEPQWGNFVPSLNRALHPIGDFVVRCMLERIDILTGILATYRSKVRAVASSEIAVQDSLLDEHVVWGALNRATADLRVSSNDAPAARLRDSCVILTQVFVGFQAIRPKVDWLGLPEWIVERGRTLGGHCGSRTAPELFDRIAMGLNDLKSLYDGQMPTRSAIEESIATGGLVIETGTRRVYWKCKPIEPKKLWASQRRQFDILCKLAQAAKAGTGISATDIYEYIVADSTLSTAVNRLRELLLHERELEARIVSGSKPGTYRLDLSRDEIFIL
jgi:hypothetical protein